MNKEDERALLILLGIGILSRYSWKVVPAIENAGARLYDYLHNDAGHVKDLPGKQLTRQMVLSIATHAGFPDPKLAAAIALAESGGVPGAFVKSSREYSVGLWQINTKVHPYSVDDMKDPIKNAEAAFKISKGGTDWRPWSAFTNGRYLQFKTGILA
jgi:hypothetical protein